MARRVALARALALRPRILVLDEPFVSLDDRAAASLREIVVETVGREGMSVLMVTHNVAEAIEIADRLLLVSARPSEPARRRDPRPAAQQTRPGLVGGHARGFGESLSGRHRRLSGVYRPA